MNTPMTCKERFLRACQCKTVDRPPIWMMRQAGRSLPEYRALKTGHSFTELVQDPATAAEITLQPIRRFGYDAAIVFSDILVIAEALGQHYELLQPQGGIKMNFAADSEAAIERLNPTGIRDRIAYTPAAIQLVRKTLGDSRALIGFAGAPWTLASYMIEGGSSPDNLRARAMAFDNPSLLQNLLEKITAATIDYLQAQIEAGADAVQIFDSQGGTLTRHQYWELSGRWIEKIVAALGGAVPVIVFARGVHHDWQTLKQTGADALSIDWNMDLRKIADQLPASIAVQGNLDPAVLLADPESAVIETQRLLGSMRDRAGFIFNLGHGVPPNARIDTLAAIAKTVQTWNG